MRKVAPLGATALPLVARGQDGTGVPPRARQETAIQTAMASAAPVACDPLDESLLTAAEVARILGVRTKRVYELGIPAVRLSEKCLRWRRAVLQIWIDQRTEGDRR